MQFQLQGFKVTRPVARLCDPKRKFYEAFFLVYVGKQKIPKRFKKGINDKKTPAQRREWAEIAAGKLWEALQMGWNPLEVPYPIFEDEVAKVKALTFNEAIDLCLAEKEKTLKVSYLYKSIARRIKKVAIKSGYAYRKITDMQRRDIRMLISDAKDEYDWTPKARNQCLAIIKSLLSVLIDKDILQVNPAHKIKPEKQADRTKYKRISQTDRERIFTHLSRVAPHYLEFICFVYDTGIRPKELHLIKISDVNLSRREIKVRAEVSKTNKERLIPITDDMLSTLIGRQINTVSPDWYLFSKNKFLPGPKPYWPTAGRNWWNRYVQKGLGIDAKLYGLKHTGLDEKILAGIDIRALKELAGHSSEQMTESYIEELHEIHKRKIIAKAPSFSAKVIAMKKAE